MRKVIIGTLVGTVIFFAYQSFMWAGGIHKDYTKYSPNQDSVMASLQANNLSEGLYFMPGVDPADPDADKKHEEMMTTHEGKPWAMIFYHESMSFSGTYVIFGVLYTLIACLIASLVLYSGNFGSFRIRFLVCMSFALFTLSQGVLDEMNWWGYPWSFMKTQVIDLTIGWAICSIWLAKYVRK